MKSEQVKRTRKKRQSLTNTAFIARLIVDVFNGTGLAEHSIHQGTRLMIPARWLLIGAVGLGIAIAIYVIFFCPTECQ